MRRKRNEREDDLQAKKDQPLEAHLRAVNDALELAKPTANASVKLRPGKSGRWRG
jgi:hypothetical protein